MAQIMNFKRMEVTGATKEEALAKAPFSIMGDATQAYKAFRKKQVNGVTDADKKQFMLDYLDKKSKNVAGVGFSITEESAVADTRERPYTIHDNKNTSGARKYKTIYQIYENLGTSEKPVKGKLLKEVDTTKTDSKNVGKSMWADEGFKGNVVCYYTKQVIEGEAIAWTGEYTPSKSSRVGTYVVFGIERD